MFRLKTLFGFGNRMVFDGEENEANNTNADGGNAGDVNKAGGGGVDKDKDESANKPETHTINVDGTDVVLTIKELKERASKSSGADKRFQEAATATKAAEKGIRVEALVKSISGADAPNEAEVRELAGLLEIDPKEFMTSLHEEDKSSQKSTSKAAVTDFNDEFKKQMGASPAEVRAILEHSSTRHVSDARKEIREISDKAVDKDEIIGKMVIGEDKDEVVLAVKDMVAEDVLRKIQDGKPFGAEMVTASVQRVRSQLTKLGIPKKLNQQPIILGLGPSEGFSSAIQADEPIKRVPSPEDGDEKNLVARYLQKVVKAVREQR
jgi:hypothetical protein